MRDVFEGFVSPHGLTNDGLKSLVSLKKLRTLDLSHAEMPCCTELPENPKAPNQPSSTSSGRVAEVEMTTRNRTRIETVEITGYQPIRHDRPLTLEKLGQRNIFIGPNNAGKSTLFRFLRSITRFPSNDIIERLGPPVVEPNWWWQSEQTDPIVARVTMTGKAIHRSSLPEGSPQLESEDTWHIKAVIHPPDDTGFSYVELAPEAYWREGWLPLTRESSSSKDAFDYLDVNGDYAAAFQPSKIPIAKPAKDLLRRWKQSLCFIDPLRSAASERSGDAPGGTTLTTLLHRMQSAGRLSRDYDELRDELIEELNALVFAPSRLPAVRSLEVKADQSGQDIYIRRAGDLSAIPLQSMGTGISQLVVLYCELLLDRQRDIFFIEEPEAHLHPGLLRRFVRRLREHDAQFFVTTHSPTVIDSLSVEDSVFEFSFDTTKGVRAERCEKATQHHDLLDRLGVRASTLLQTNCSIWVEGPSDRIYLRNWLRRRAPMLVEGSDYFFVFYGGKLLSHLDLGGRVDASGESVASLHWLCRRSVVLMDRDYDPNDSKGKLRGAKQAVLASALEDPKHRLAVTTIGREIEYDVDRATMYEALRKLLDEPIPETLPLRGTQAFTSEVLAGLSISDKRRKSARNKLRQKVQLADIVAKLSGTETSVPTYIDQIVAFIERPADMEF